jgi:hypothetical protein
MNSGHSTPNQFALPHYSHSEPWAHDVICCDTDHNASTSRPSTPITRFASHHRSQPSTSTINSFDAPVSAQTSTCCDETHCADVDGLECCTDPACQQGAICEDDTCRFPHNPDAAPGDPDSAESMRELERWACSKEGCHAIQQYVSFVLGAASPDSRATIVPFTQPRRPHRPLVEQYITSRYSFLSTSFPLSNSCPSPCSFPLIGL